MSKAKCENDIVYGLSEISLYLSNIGKDDFAKTIEDACRKLESLKEQEPVKPLAQADDTFECICGAIVGWDELDASGIVQERFNYCPFCGKPIDWKGR